MKVYEIVYPAFTKKGEMFYQHLKLPMGVFNSKVYPECAKCGGKYVPINKGDKECYRCTYEKRKKVADVAKEKTMGSIRPFYKKP